MRFPKFQFYEVVYVSSLKPELTEVYGQTGAILGMAEDDKGQFYYGVFIAREEMCWSIAEQDLRTTGVIAEHSAFYDDNQSLRGRIDGQERGLLLN